MESKIYKKPDKPEYGIRITDIWFVSTILIVFITTLVCVLFGLDIPFWLNFWWVTLTPILIKSVAPNSRFVEWLEKERW
jgi:hypothetical protein